MGPGINYATGTAVGPENALGRLFSPLILFVPSTNTAALFTYVHIHLLWGISLGFNFEMYLHVVNKCNQLMLINTICLLQQMIY